jgi:uncharacterized SAM-binding protein YcdF (DUF218 family)
LPGLPPPRPLTRQSPARKRRPRRPPPRKRWSKPRVYAALTLIFLVCAVFGWAALARAFAPVTNTQLTHFDAIIVLGYKADSDGNPTPRQLSRVTEGVHEYMRGVAPRLILTGGPASNRFVEARVMAHTAESEGIPASAIYVEPQAQDTIQNLCYSERIMHAHDWRSAEVVSSAYHLPRAAMILNHLPLEWRTHAAPPLAPESSTVSAAVDLIETLKTVRYLVYAQWADRCDP